ncbi:LOW QUALITY PROTEIN: hypothetical protein PHMEG_00016868 [Phytophthora megakarya]|uniref:Eukaryotic/viral aspartic protease n=1 Tax=Phytophthora megakarya TaxID=4795 RepID=A0A225VXP0_9STRA|nr:LOW QUALITY PROTEIN: hypothetical protein PHMEG_00016868 [Phytophthora megakarya]
MARRFRKLYIGTTGSYSERYFTMKMTDHETSLQFFYRLNAAAVKAEVKFKWSPKLRESHIRSFIKKLRNDQLKTALKGHRFQSITDLERVLRRHEDVWREEGYDSPAPKKPRDFRADNVHQGWSQNRGPPRRRTQGDTRPTQDSEFQHESQNPEAFAEQAEAHSKRISEFLNSGIDGEVFRVTENQHWKSPNPHPGPGLARPENWDVFCENCKKWGHSELKDTQPESLAESLVQNMEGFTVEYRWKAFLSVMAMAKQGNAIELPTQFRSLLQTKVHASGAQQLNH